MKILRNTIVSASLVAATMSIAAPAQAGPDDYLGEISIVGFTFCPRGTTELNGQILPISQYQALFSLLGTTYGGDGRTSFGLPDLRGRAPIHTGTGPGLSGRSLGSRGGSETNTMTVAQMPSHNHRGGIRTKGQENANSRVPNGRSFAKAASNSYIDGVAPTAGFMNAGTVFVDNQGGGQAQNNMQPFLTLRYCIATIGTFPSRN